MTVVRLTTSTTGAVHCLGVSIICTCSDAFIVRIYVRWNHQHAYNDMNYHIAQFPNDVTKTHEYLSVIHPGFCRTNYYPKWPVAIGTRCRRRAWRFFHVRQTQKKNIMSINCKDGCQIVESNLCNRPTNYPIFNRSRRTSFRLV